MWNNSRKQAVLFLALLLLLPAAPGRVARARALSSWERELAGRVCAPCGTCRREGPAGAGGMAAARRVERFLSGGEA
jgi:hypothetical protein